MVLFFRVMSKRSGATEDMSQVCFYGCCFQLRIVRRARTSGSANELAGGDVERIEVFASGGDEVDAESLSSNYLATQQRAEIRVRTEPAGKKSAHRQRLKYNTP